MPNKLLIALAVVIAGIAGATAFSKPAAANVQNFHFSEFRAIYQLNATDSGTTLDVHELLVAEFPDFNQNKGIVREIPRTNQGGANITLRDLAISVLRNGSSEPIWSLERRGQWFEVSTGTDAYLRGTQRFELFYQFQNVITDFGTHQELYWDANGTAWQQRFNRVSATVLLPPHAANGFTDATRCFVGVHGSTNQTDCDTVIDTDGSSVTFTALRPLNPSENLTFVLAFAPDTFIVPDSIIPVTYSPFILATVLASVNGLLFAVFAVLYYKRVAQPKKLHKPAFTPPQYLPPKDLSLAAAATLTSKAAGSTVAAQLLDMAVRHKVKLIEQSSATGQNRLLRALSTTKYAVEIQRVDELLPDDRELLRILGGTSELTNGQTISLSPSFSTRSQTAIQLQKYSRDSVYKRLAEQGIVRPKRPKFLTIFSTLQLFIVFFFFAACIGFITSAEADLYQVALKTATWCLTISILLTTPFILYFASHERKFAHLLPSGWQQEAYLRGLYDYIKLAETDRLKFLQSVKGAERVNTDDKTIVKLYEQVLPYAVLFRLEKSWTKALQSHVHDDYHPSWYVGTGAFHMSSFSNNLSAFSSSMSSNYGAGSSGSSGMSSGSSGGGGGGGGGGGR